MAHKRIKIKKMKNGKIKEAFLKFYFCFLIRTRTIGIVTATNASIRIIFSEKGVLNCISDEVGGGGLSVVPELVVELVAEEFTTVL